MIFLYASSTIEANIHFWYAINCYKKEPTSHLLKKDVKGNMQASCSLEAAAAKQLQIQDPKLNLGIRQSILADIPSTFFLRLHRFSV